MRTIAIINQKGGCGKTTTAINLSSMLARRGKRTLLIDLDPQSHCAAGLNIPESRIDLDITDALLAVGTKTLDPARLLWRAARNMDVAPSRMRLAGLEAPKGPLADAADKETRLATLIRAFEGQYDIVCIDCPPSIGLLTYNALVAATTILIPVETGFFSLQGATKQFNTVKTLSRRLKSHPPVWIVPTIHEAGNTVSDDLLAELHRRFKDRVAPVIIHRDSKLREAVSFGQLIADYAPDSTGAADYAELAKWLDSELAPNLESKNVDLLIEPEDDVAIEGTTTTSTLSPAAIDPHRPPIPSHRPTTHIHADASATPKPLTNFGTNVLQHSGSAYHETTKPLNGQSNGSSPTAQPAVVAAAPTLPALIDDATLARQLAHEVQPGFAKQASTQIALSVQTRAISAQFAEALAISGGLTSGLSSGIASGVASGSVHLLAPTSGTADSLLPLTRGVHAQETKPITRAEDVARRAQDFLKRIALGRANSAPVDHNSVAARAQSTDVAQSTGRAQTNDGLYQEQVNTAASSTATLEQTQRQTQATFLADATLSTSPLKLIDSVVPTTPPPSIHRIFGVRRTSSGVLFVQPMSMGTTIAIAGTFNNWSPTTHILKPNADLGVFELCLPLSKGRHMYRLVVDGVWVADPYNDVAEPNGFGEVNCIVQIG